MAAGSDVIMGCDEVKKFLERRRDYFAPEAANSVYPEVPRFTQFGCTAPTTNEYLAPIDLLRRKAGSKMQTGGASPQLFASAPCARNASNPRSEKWLALASVQGNLGISAVAQQMRRLFGRHGGVGRRDVFQAADVDVTSSEDDDFAGWVAYRKA